VRSGLGQAATALGPGAREAPIRAVATAAQADLLVTGDRPHVEPLCGRSPHGVLVLSLADGLAAVLAAVARGDGSATP